MELISIDIQLFESLLKDLEEVANESERLCLVVDYNTQQWLDTQDVCKILNVCKRTLQSFRDSGRLPFTQIERKYYYKPEDVENLLQSLHISNK